jgi:hypothetical protein
VQPISQLRDRIAARIAAFGDTAATIGIGDACLYAASRAANAMFRGRVRIIKYYFMAQPIDASAADPGSRGTFDIAFATPDSTLFSQFDRPAGVIAARFAKGARCIAATDSEARLAGFLWYVVGPYDEDEVRARFVPKPDGRSAWDFDVTIAPRYRMGRLFASIWRRASIEMAASGVRHTLSRISAFNVASLASHQRLGARRLGSALFVCIGRVQLMRGTLAPRWHLSWREEQRPVLFIEA